MSESASVSKDAPNGTASPRVRVLDGDNCWFAICWDCAWAGESRFAYANAEIDADLHECGK